MAKAKEPLSPAPADRINVEAILDDLYASEINVEISWLWEAELT